MTSDARPSEPRAWTRKPARTRFSGSGVILIALTALLSGALTSLWFARTGEAVPEAPARAAVFDLERVFENSAERKVVQDQLYAKLEQRAKSLENEKTAIEQRKKELALLKPGSDEAMRVQGEVYAREGQLKAQQQNFDRDAMAMRNEFFDRVLAGIREVVARYAREHQIDVVFQKAFKMTEESPSWDSVFYNNPTLDITEDIIGLVKE